MKSHDISIWEVKQKTPARTDKKGRKKPATYQVRWAVGGKEKYRTFKNKALANAWRSKLDVAMQNGESFDTVTGLPDSLAEKPEQVTWYVFAATYMDMKWKTLSAKARETTVYALSATIAALVNSKPGRPDMQTLRRALQQWYLEPSKRKAVAESDSGAAEPAPAGRSGERKRAGKPPADIAKALSWLEKNSLPVEAIAEAKHARAVLDALATNMDGTAAKVDYLKRRRGVAANVARFAIERGELKEDPFKSVQWTPPKQAKQLDRRRVPNPTQVRQLLLGAGYVGTWKRAGGRRYVAFFGCLYYAMMRPEEVIGLRKADCELPKAGWGLITLHKATPYAGKRWTDSGELHDDKALKARADGETRPVPIPPVLVRMLNDHIEEFGVGPDGLIFRTEKGRPVTPFAYQRVWKKARHFALPPSRVDSSLADVPYDLRHAGISLGLRTTRDAALIAERAGQSVAVLMERYAWALDDSDDAANKAIEDGLDDG